MVHPISEVCSSLPCLVSTVTGSGQYTVTGSTLNALDMKYTAEVVPRGTYIEWFTSMHFVTPCQTCNLSIESSTLLMMNWNVHGQ